MVHVTTSCTHEIIWSFTSESHKTDINKIPNLPDNIYRLGSGKVNYIHFTAENTDFKKGFKKSEFKKKSYFWCQGFLEWTDSYGNSVKDFQIAITWYLVKSKIPLCNCPHPPPHPHDRTSKPLCPNVSELYLHNWHLRSKQVLNLSSGKELTSLVRTNMSFKFLWRLKDVIGRTSHSFIGVQNGQMFSQNM